MIARIWKARATAPGADAYGAYFTATVVPELNAIPGFQGSTLLRRSVSAVVEVTVITWWTSLDAVRSFAGEAVQTAVVHDSAARLLLDFDSQVAHHEVVFNARRLENGP